MSFHPWRLLRGMPEWSVRFIDLPDELLGYTEHAEQRITIATGLTQAQRRATLAHELEHVSRPPFAVAEIDAEEALCDQLAAEKLIPLDRLVDALRWALDEREMATELWVDTATVRARLDNLTADEKAYIEKELDDEWR